MGWEPNNHAPPVPRDPHKPFHQAYNHAADHSDRPDSILDSYADYYDYGAGDDDDASTPLPEVQVEPPVQRREPWDTRGKTGLYGGGGRGADDHETGWVTDYSSVGRSDVGYGTEEDLRFGDARSTSQPEAYRERRRSSSGTEHSSYGPVTPVSSTFDAMASSHHHDPYGAKVPSVPPVRPTRPGPGEAEVPRLNQTRHAHSQSQAHSRTASRPGHYGATSFDSSDRQVMQGPPHPSQGAPGSPNANATSRLKKKTPGSPRIPPPPQISAPISIRHDTPPPVGAMREAAREAAAEEKRRKSVSFKWGGRSKKMPTISNPILPEGFVESLGMETFALTPGCAPPAHNTPIKPKKDRKATITAPRPKRSSPGPGQPASLPPSILRQPELVRTPLDALRDVGAGTPVEARPLRRLSEDSDFSVTPTTAAAQAEQERQRYFHELHDRHNHPHEVQANRPFGSSNATSSSTTFNPKFNQAPRRGSASTAKYYEREAEEREVMYDQARQNAQAQGRVPEERRPSDHSTYTDASRRPSDDFRDPWRPGRPSLTNSERSGDIELYFDTGDGYATPASSHSNFSLDRDDNDDTSAYSETSPRSEAQSYGSLPGTNFGNYRPSIQSSGLPSSNGYHQYDVPPNSTAPLNLGRTGLPSKGAPPPPPASHHQARPSTDMGDSNLFRNPAAKVIQGHLNTELNAEGEAQARVVAKFLKGEVKFDEAWSSDLNRAAKTAKAIVDEQEGLVLKQDPRIRERFLGALQGKVAGTVDRVAFAHTMEPMSELHSRMFAFWDTILPPDDYAPTAAPKQILVVSHGAAIRGFVAALVDERKGTYKLDLGDRMGDWKADKRLGNCSITKVVVEKVDKASPWTGRVVEYASDDHFVESSRAPSPSGNADVVE